MSKSNEKLLDNIYEDHRLNIENNLRQIVNSYATSISRSASSDDEMRLFFESFRKRVKNLCRGACAKRMASIKEEQISLLTSNGNVNETDLASKPLNKDDEVDEKAALTKVSSTLTDEPTPLTTISDMDIDQFLLRAQNRVALAPKRPSFEDSSTENSPKRQYPSEKSEITKNKVKHLSSKMAKNLRSHLPSILDTALLSSGRIRAFCFFCEQTMEESLDAWKVHLLKHTGEKEYYCSGCHTELSSKDSPEHCMGHVIRETFSDANLQAFMCNICDYIKVNNNEVIEHIKNDHTKSMQGASDHVKKVTLIPNVCRLTVQVVSKYKFVPAACRYDCGIEDCIMICYNKNEFKDHFFKEHPGDKKYVCTHCKEEIIRNATDDQGFFLAIIRHLELHDSCLYQCGVCNMQFVGDADVIEHFSMEHSASDCLYHREIRSVKQTENLDEINILFECNLCSARFFNQSTASNHYLKLHNSINFDLTLIKLVKKVNDTKWSKSMEWNMKLQQHFVCNWCGDTYKIKENFVHHHVERHQFKELSIGFRGIYLTDNSDEPWSRFDQYLVYYCQHCCSVAIFGDVNDVYSHWKLVHEQTKPVKPFRFMVAQLVLCNYCNEVSTFEGLKIHQAKQHPKSVFSIRNLLNRSNCGLCSDAANDLVHHSIEQNHQTLLEMKIFNPIAMSEDILKKLVNVKGHKKRKCKHCTEVFETKDKFYEHHDHKHQSIKAKYEKIYDNGSIHMICGCCKIKINPEHLFDHLKYHGISSIEHLKTFYWETMVVLGNGLILNKYNFFGTEVDDSKDFFDEIETHDWSYK
ncbi:zinc finger protein 808-like [Contarinia nasturtii]|uniref:zinc finger protein 808-like n=1 Tax=Contarinia nasturtii TaxID=265458 RepID=UPI0012D44E6F|nr:zinc finger protein 808-like [Contarinia nasturtii]